MDKKLSRLSCTEVNIKFGRKFVFRLERSSLGHQVRIRRGWRRWIHRTPQGDQLIYRQEIVAFILYRSEPQVFGRKCVFRLERSSLGHQVRIRGKWRPWIHRTPWGDHLIYRQEIVAFILYRSELQVCSKMCVSSGEVYSGPSSPHKGRVVSLDSQSPAGGPFDI